MIVMRALHPSELEILFDGVMKRGVLIVLVLNVTVVEMFIFFRTASSA